VIAALLVVSGRPNALDREVSALSVTDLLHRSPPALLDPARAAAALHLEQFRTPLWIAMVLLQIAVLAWFWRSGNAARVRDRLRALLRSEFATRFCFGALVAGLAKVAALIPQSLEYRYMRILDLNNILFRSFLVEWFAATLLAMAVAGAIAAIVLWLADRTHQWYVYAIAGVMGFMLLVSYANPLAFAPAYSRFVRPQLSRPLQREYAALEAAANVRVPIVEELIARRTRLGAFYVIGWGGTQRAVISDTMLAGTTAGEIRFVLARGLSWAAADTGLHVALVQGAFLVLGTALSVFISDRIGFRRDDDPVSRLALLGAVMGAVYLVALPFYNGYARSVDRVTDAAALALTHDPASAVRLEVRQTDQSLYPLCPNTLDYWYLDSRVPSATRISNLRGEANWCAVTPRR